MSGRALVVCLLGAESTGKTTLAGALGAALAARGLAVDIVGEALRDFCAAAGRTPRREEQAAIAATQSARIERVTTAGNDIVVADTSALMV
ncbi:MAG: AAA family ATPase, partial [Caldimonas sp.]